MNIESFNKWGTLISNIAVIAGIAFLGYELNQNNENLEAQSRYNYRESRGEANLQNAHDPVLAEILVKAGNNSELTPTEEMQLNSYFRYMFVGFEWGYGESLRGRAEMSATTIKGFFDAFPQAKELWPRAKSTYNRSFREFVDNEVIVASEMR